MQQEVNQATQEELENRLSKPKWSLTNNKGNLLERAGASLDEKNDRIQKLVEEKSTLENQFEQKVLDFSVSEQKSGFLSKKNLWLMSKIDTLKESQEDVFRFMQDNGRESKDIINEISENLRSTELQNLDYEMQVKTLEAKIVEFENSESFLKMSNRNFETLQNFYQELSNRSDSSNQELIRNMDQLYSIVTKIVKGKILDNFSVEKDNKILQEKIDSLQKIFQISKSAFLKRIGYQNKRFNELTQRHINNYKKLLDISHNNLKLSNEISNSRIRENNIKQKFEKEQPKVDPLALLKHIFGENYSKYVTNDTRNLEEFLEKVEKLDLYLSKLKTDVSKMEKQKVYLKEDLQKKNQQLREMYRLECDIGFEEAFKIKNELNETRHANLSMVKEIKSLKEKNEILRIQRETERQIGIERKNNVSALIFLNGILKKRLYQHEKDIDFTNFNLAYFKKERIISSRQKELISNIDQLQSSEEKLKIENFSLQRVLRQKNDTIGKLQSEIESLQKSVKSCNEKIEDYETHNLLVVKGKKNLQKFESYINDLNKESMLKEADTIKKEVEAQLKNNAILEAKNLKMETELNILIASSKVLEERNAKLIEIIRGQNILDGLSKDSDARKTIELLFNGDLRYKTQNEQLKRRNRALKTRILSFKTAFEAINEFYEESGHKSKKLYEKISGLYENFKDKIFDSKELLNDLDMIQGLELENSGLKSKVKLLEQIHLNSMRNLEIKNDFLLDLNQISESRGRNLTRMVVDFSRRVDKLQRERQKLEANSILERLKDYLERKMKSLDTISQDYKSSLERFNSETTQGQEKNQNLENELQKIFEGETEIFKKMKQEFESKFELIMTSAKNQIEEAKAKASMGVTAKENEINELKSQLSKASFEGKEEMISKIKELCKQVKILKSQIIDLNLRNDLKEVTADIMIEEQIASNRDSSQGELSKIQLDFQSKISDLENQKEQIRADKDKEVGDLAQKLQSSKNEVEELRLKAENLEKERQKVEKEQQDSDDLDSQEEFKKKYEDIMKTKKADFEYCNDIFKTWEKEKEQEEETADPKTMLQKLEDHFSTLKDWLVNQEVENEENGFTKEEMLNMA